MHIQLAVLSLVAMSVVVATENVGDCLFEPCRRHLGVYYLIVAVDPAFNSYEVATFSADGTFSVIDSDESGLVNPPFPAYSNINGVWECNGYNKIKTSVAAFFYPTQVTPRYLTTGVYDLQFIGNDHVSGTATFDGYNLTSTENPDRSKWIEIAGPVQYTVKGYKLFNRCGH